MKTPTTSGLDLTAIRAATPEPWVDLGWVTDRFVLNGPAFAAWCAEHFGIRTRCDAETFIQEICPLGERVVIDAASTA